MDTSETYIKMCDCKEIQKQWKLTNIDYHGIPCADNHDYSTTITKPCPTKGFPHQYEVIIIWLPRQDQIQELMAKELKYEKVDNNFLYDSLCDLYKLSSVIDFYNTCHTFEQLWLAFYMHGKYFKVWDGEKWVRA